MLGAGPRQSPPNVVLVTLDTTRADRMGFLGSKLGLTPNLDRLALESVVFSRAYAQVPLTTASHAVILTGTFPQFNGVNDFGKPLPPDIPYLPELLHQRGYTTAAFVGSLVLDPVGGTAPGFDRGFDGYDAGFRMHRASEDRYKTVERRADEVVSHALKWLRGHSGGPVFLWVHLYDPHDPYEPPAPYAEKFKAAPYDGEIAYVDAAVGRLLQGLRAVHRYENTVIAVVGDHGEALGEHGEKTHGIFLYDETIHVPMLMKLPFGGGAGRRVEGRVGLVDVAPTLLEAARITVPTAMQGKSRYSGMASLSRKFGRTESANGDQGSPQYSETDYPRRAFGWSTLQALRSGKYLFVEALRKELYDQSTDARAAKNLSAVSPAVTQTLAAQLQQFRERTSSKTAEAKSASVDPEQAQKLGALGYVASDAGTAAKGEADLADPKDKVEIANLVHAALMAVENGDYEAAVPLLEKTVREQPQMAIAQMQLGISLTHLKHYERALPALHKAIELLPDSGMAHYELGLALFATGKSMAAADQFEKAVARAPRWADAHFSLASVYARTDRIPQAMKELDLALSLNPDHYRANLLRGRILSLQGEAKAGLRNLEKASEVEPQSQEAHSFLADAYEQLGWQDKAARERAEAGRLKDARSQ